MKAEIILVGTELLLGQISDTNGAFLGRELAGFGIELYHIQVVGDNLGRMVEVFQQALARADILIISGGLGPTVDDLTREAIAKVLHESLEFREEAWIMAADFFKRRGRTYTENNKRQAMYPPSAEIIDNQWGTAPGVWVQKEKKIMIALPGVPRELENMFKFMVVPKLISAGAFLNTIVSKIIHMIGIGESAMEERIKDLLEAQTNPTLAPYAGNQEVLVRLTAKADNKEEAYGLIKPMEEEVLKRLGEYCYGFDEDSLPGVVKEFLQKKNLTLAIAESCTGGLLSHLLTNIPGISDNYKGGLIAYANDVKIDFLRIESSKLEQFGAVSPETAEAMAQGVRIKMGTDLGIAITGIAGPGGGTAEKPVGLVYISLASKTELITEKHLFPWEREFNKNAAAKAALALLWRFLKKAS